MKLPRFGILKDHEKLCRGISCEARIIGKENGLHRESYRSNLLYARCRPIKTYPCWRRLLAGAHNLYRHFELLPRGACTVHSFQHISFWAFLGCAVEESAPLCHYCRAFAPRNPSPNDGGCSRFALQGEDFHRMLTIARLTALSLGDASVTAEHWGHMKDLETRVAGRMQQHAGRATSSAGVAPAAATSPATGEATPVSPGNSTGPLNAIPENE